MQDIIWEENVTWDESFPEYYQERWLELAEELSELLSTTIPRYRLQMILFLIYTYSQISARELTEPVHIL